MDIDWGEPHTGQTVSPTMFISLYLSIYLSMFIYMYRTSFRMCPLVLIHWTASILLSVIAITFRDSFNFALAMDDDEHVHVASTAWSLFHNHDFTTVRK